MEDEYTTDETLPESVDYAADGGSADSNQSQDVNTLSLEEIQQTLGKQFPDKATALKAIKDTFSWVGKKQQAAKVQTSQVDTSNFVDKSEVQALRDELWVKDHADLKDHFALIKAFAKESGKTYDEALEAPELKGLVEAKKAQAEVSKSVIHSNARVQEFSADYEADREKAIKSGNWVEFMEKHKGVRLD